MAPCQIPWVDEMPPDSKYNSGNRADITSLCFCESIKSNNSCYMYIFMVSVKDVIHVHSYECDQHLISKFEFHVKQSQSF